MKRVKKLTVLLIGIVLFAGCVKDSNNDLQATDADIVYTKNNATYPVAINYQLAIQQSGAGSIIQWNNGYLNANNIVFNATHQNGDDIVQGSYGTQIGQTITLFNTKTLGNVYVPKLTSDHASFTVGLDTLSNTNYPSLLSVNYAMLLNGTYNMENTGPIDVHVIINQPVDLNSIWINNVTTETTNYWKAAIVLSTDQLTNGIDANMMNNATRANSIIMITSTSNQNLYQIILNNLENNMMQVQFSPEYYPIISPQMSLPNPANK